MSDNKSKRDTLETVTLWAMVAAVAVLIVCIIIVIVNFGQEKGNDTIVSTSPTPIVSASAQPGTSTAETPGLFTTEDKTETVNDNASESNSAEVSKEENENVTQDLSTDSLQEDSAEEQVEDATNELQNTPEDIAPENPSDATESSEENTSAHTDTSERNPITEAETVPASVSTPVGITINNDYNFPQPGPVFEYTQIEPETEGKIQNSANTVRFAAATANEVATAGYFYEKDINVSLSYPENEEAVIYYTLDGTEPVPDAEGTHLYSEPLTLAASADAAKPNVYCFRALAVLPDGTKTFHSAHTYFVGTGLADRFSTIVVSITGDPMAITEGPDGIFYGSNVFQHGRESEVSINTEILSPSGKLILSQFSGLRIFGGESRKRAIPSVKIFARKTYSPKVKRFEFELFGTPVSDGNGIVSKYDKLVLRNGGDDFQRSFLRDELNMKLAAQAGFDTYENVIPATVYLNGKYYSLSWFHEYYCDEYFKNIFGDSEGEYVVLEGTEEYKSLKGEDDKEDRQAKKFNSFYYLNCYSDMTNEENYARVCEFMDVENYLRYYAYQLYISNNDWPENNYRCYRYIAADGEDYEPGTVRDGRWRFLLHDTDISFGTYQENDYVNNDYAHVIEEGNLHYSPLFAGLMKREDCREYFVAYTYSLMNGVFQADNVSTVVEKLAAMRDEELTYYIDHILDLKAAGAQDLFVSKKDVNRHIKRIKEYAEKRPEYVVKYLEEMCESCKQ